MADATIPLTSGGFYIYIYLDPRPERSKAVIYVGKGRGGSKRAFDHWRKPAKNHVLRRILANIRKLGLIPEIEIVAQFEHEADAFVCERRLIARFGRLDRGTGTLANFTDGGEGTVGWRPSAEYRAKLGRISAARWEDVERRAALSRTMQDIQGTPEARARVIRQWANPELRERQRVRQTARWQNPASRAEMLPAERVEKIKRAWADPLIREKINAARNIAMSSEGYKQAQASRASALWADPDRAAHIRARQREAILARSEEAREAMFAAQKAAYATPEGKARRGAASKRAWAGPEKKASRSAAIKAGWARRRAALAKK